MAEVDKLHLTKKRLQNLRRRSLGLQQLAVRVISKQLTFYTTQHDELEKLKSLPGVLRDKILQVLMKKKCLDMQGREMEFENLKVVFPLLLSPRTRYIELNSILSFCPDWFNDSNIDKVTPWCVELLKHIETRAPQVETLIIKRNNSSLYEVGGPWYSEFVEFSQDMVKSLMKMGKLNRLTVGSYYFDSADLLKICKNLPKLQYINIELVYNRGNVRPATEDVTSSLCNLKELIFLCPSRFTNDYLSYLYTRNLPNIEVVGCDPNQTVDLFGIRRDANRYLDFRGPSNLRNIFLFTESAEEAESMPKLFPNVTSLMVNNISNCGRGLITLEEHVMPKFDNIRQFHLLNPCSGVFEKYLSIYGQKLQSLYLGHHYGRDETIDFNLIFKYCPTLEKLSMRNMCFKTPLSKLDFFAQLKELEWTDLNYHCNPHGIPGPESKDFLSNILSAPKLEKVKLESSVCMQYDLRKLNSLIEENQILNNLNTLHVYYFEYHIDDALANVLRSACAYLPKLTDFKFGKRHKFEDPLLPIQSTPLSDIDESVCEMIGVFEHEN